MFEPNIFIGAIFLTVFTAHAEPPLPNYYNSVPNYGPPRQNSGAPPQQNYRSPQQNYGTAPYQNYGAPPQQESYGSRQQEGQSFEQSIDLSGPTVTCTDGRLMSTPAGMAVILPCMELYRDNMTCVEYCYAAKAMSALCEDGEIDFDKYISFIPKNFPSNVVNQVTGLWGWCIRQYGRQIDKYDKTCQGLNSYSQCLFTAFMIPC